MKELVIVVGIFVMAVLIGSEIAHSNYNAFDSPVTPITPMPIVTTGPLPMPTSLPEGVIYDDTLAGVGTLNISPNKPFVVKIEEHCPPSMDYATTYFDVFGPNGKNSTFVMTGSNFTQSFPFKPGVYEFNIDNLCPATRVMIKYA